MYCSIEDAWNQENTMSNLAKRFNKEYFSNNNDINDNYYRINKNHLDNQYKPLIENFDSSEEKPKINIPVNSNFTAKKVEVEKETCPENEKSCEKLVEKVLSCSKCKNLIIKKLNLKSKMPLEINFDSLLKGNNRELIILILIGLIIIIVLDLFLKLSKSLN